MSFTATKINIINRLRNKIKHIDIINNAQTTFSINCYCYVSLNGNFQF